VKTIAVAKAGKFTSCMNSFCRELEKIEVVECQAIKIITEENITLANIHISPSSDVDEKDCEFLFTCIGKNCLTVR
jgi:hypothetical protein